MDADMIVKGDVAELFTPFDGDVAMMIQQAEFEWASMMVFNCERCKILTPDFIEDRKNLMFDRKWAQWTASLPQEWNHCVGYEPVMPAKLYHYTQGIPVWAETRGVEDQPFMDEAKAMLKTVSWAELMGSSIHAPHVMERLNAKSDLTSVSH